MASAWTNIHISPSPGFCIKSKLLHSGFLNQVALPQGLKVFINVAWSKDLPPPPNGVKKTLTGDHQTHSDDSSIYAFTSDGRLDTDKGAVYDASCRGTCLTYALFYLAGNPAVVFDCIYHSSFKSYVVKDADVKKLLIGKCRRHSRVVTGLVVRSNGPAFAIRVSRLISISTV
jgi:hypothetical protein